MNLHGIVSGAIQAVNPNRPATFYASVGSSTGQDGQRYPRYSAGVAISAQVQEMTSKDLRQLDGLNVQGVTNAIYLYGQAAAVVRSRRKGGDLIVVDGETYLTVLVFEQWPDWVKIAVALQDDALAPFVPLLDFSNARDGQYVPLVFP